MFESYYKLDANPFRLSADEQFRFAHKNYQKAYSYLKYALDQGEGFIMVTGQPGSGKTTLIRDIVSEVDDSKILAINLVTNQLQAEELLRKVALEFGLHAESYNKATLLTSIEDFVTKEYQTGRRAVIVIDEAQNLTLNGLEELRLLSNLQAGSHPLFQIFLVGQDELRSLILSPGMEQIRQRMIASCQIEAMDAQQSQGYIEHRLGIVGWDRDPAFEEMVFPLIHYLTGGIPRKINHVVSRLLLYGALEEKHEFTQEDVWIVARELFDEERLSIQSGDSFTTFKEKYGQGEDLLPESHKADSESEPVEQFKAIDKVHVSITGSNSEPVKAGEAKLAAQSESEYGTDVEVEPEPEPEEYISEFFPYGDSGLLDSDNPSAADAQAAEESAGFIPADETERMTPPIASGKTYLDESEQDALTSKIIREGDIRIEEVLTETNESSPDEILNLPSMQAERRKHEIEEKGGWINTAETVGVDELFAGAFGKSLRNIFFFVLAGLFFLILFVIKPERIDQIWEDTVAKIPSMIEPADDRSEVTAPTTETERQEAEVGDSLASKGDEYTNLETPVASSTAQTISEKFETSIASDQEITDTGTALADKKAAVESDSDTSLSPESLESTVDTGLVERASVDYIATQSKYQKVEIGEGTDVAIPTTPTTSKFQIYFEFDDTSIPDQFKEMLNDLYIVLSLNKASTMTITGYTDASGDPVYNMNLSVDRANAVSDYFTERGISPDRIQVEGRGPVPKSTADEHEELEKRFGNRRVEIIMSEDGE
jgi:type II secretory pathway predicted ATPase ExeA/outer membrane protein OmpA-like peptidoglycan-associated protein